MIDSVLVVEDDKLVREALGQTLELAGFRPTLAASVTVAKDVVSEEFQGVVLSDIRMPGRDGLHLLDHVQMVDADLPVILLTGEGDIPMAVGSIKRGAFDFLEKPCANDVLVESVRKAVRARELALENRRLKAEIARGDAAARMIFGVSSRAEDLRDQIRRIAQFDDPVLVNGPPGSGIAKVAEVVHLCSGRASGPFLRVAGAGLSPEDLHDRMAGAAQGTLFVDEYAHLPSETQFALLQHFDTSGGARILVGTTGPSDQPPPRLNPDLFYRVDALRVHVPALAERTEDIPVIFRQYVRQIAQQSNVAEPAVGHQVIADLLARDWPGNAGALMNAATRFVLGLDAPLEGEAVGLTQRVAQVERTLIIEALKQHQGNASATALHLQLPRKTFYDKLARHGIKPEEFR